MIIDALVEGPMDEWAARRLVRETGHEFGIGFGKRGAGHILSNLSRFQQRARFGNPLLVLLDFMDVPGSECPPAVCRNRLPEPAPGMLFRLVVPELESWLLADPKGIGRFLGISKDRVPADVENLNDPKRTLVNLARKSRLKRRREAIVPPEGMSGVMGRGYVAEIGLFIQETWNPSEAESRSPSLAKCLRRLRELN
jgi:hypothetical protein